MNIADSIQNLKEQKIRCSFVGLGAEIYIARHIAESCRGEYTVAMDENHYRFSVKKHLTPPPTLADRGPQYADMVEMGFPRRVDGVPAIGYAGKQQTVTSQGYFCPRCKIKTTDLPSTCEICALPLVSSPHLARSYHHLFPVPPFTVKKSTDTKICFGCLKTVVEGEMFICCSCDKEFCQECDMYIHDLLHNCPGCC
mmetsp:Transcript_15661/g.23332  ORF Transcript_15661/g.23332 Transcript_15661/m.23332 type:complete len:197 (+) Transcript_15661:253-843(+)